MEVFYEKGKKYNCRVKCIPYFRTSVSINGKLHQIYGDGEKDALRKKEEMRDQAKAGIDLNKKDIKIGNAFSYWLYNVKRVDKNIKASTFARYDGIFRVNIQPYDIMNSKLRDLTSAKLQKHVTSLYEDCELTTATINSTVKLWKMFTKYALEEGYFTKDPCRNITIPGKYEKSKREIEVFSPEEREKILKYMEESSYQYRVLIKLAFATGMRKGEILGLKWSDISDGMINIKRSTAVVTHVDKDGNRERYREVWDTKTANAVRSIPILDSTANMLKQHKLAQGKYFLSRGFVKTDYVFTTSEGKLIDSSSLNKSYKRMLENAGVPYRKFHTIRHTFATEAIRRGVDVKDLQMLMGHSDIDVTFIYVQSDNNSKKSAIEKIGEMM